MHAYISNVINFNLILCLFTPQYQLLELGRSSECVAERKRDKISYVTEDVIPHRGSVRSVLHAFSRSLQECIPGENHLLLEYTTLWKKQFQQHSLKKGHEFRRQRS